MSSAEYFLLQIKKLLSQNTYVNYFLNDSTGFSIPFADYCGISDKVKEYLSQTFDENFQFVGVFTSDYLWLPCLLMSIWKTGNACACIGTQHSENLNSYFLEVLCVKYLISSSENTSCKKGILVGTFQINYQKFYIWKRDVEANAKHSRLDICYGIMTSGSTGKPKVVQVPWSCILPNVNELIHLLAVQKEDNIYLSSPCTFDPFFIELFLSLLTGCTLTIVSPGIKLLHNVLLKILFQNSNYLFEKFNGNKLETCFECGTCAMKYSPITIIQMTPSVFKTWGKSNIKNVILSESSSLRILLLGGEKFPIDILELKSKNNLTKIFNIYGITEISCWAFVNSLTDERVNLSLGTALGDIVYKIDEKNQFYIGSRTRKCLIDNEKQFTEDEIVFRKTGDIVTVDNNNIYFVSRSDRLIKKFGITVNLEKIETEFLTMNEQIENCFCVFDEDTSKIALFYVNTQLEKELDLLTGYNDKELLKMKNITLKTTGVDVPNDVLEIRRVPLNCSGKCDRKKLLHMYKTVLQSTQFNGDVENILKKVWMNVLHGDNFISYGGDSVKALQIITNLEEAGIDVPKDFLIVLMQNGDYKDCLDCLKKETSVLPGGKKIKLQTELSTSLIRVWTFDMKKCVDSSPTIVNHNGTVQAIVGSHSSRLSSVEVETGRQNWTITLGDRIECSLSVNRSCTRGVIGCYDHCVYSIAISDGSIIWKYKTGDIIKSAPCFSTDEAVVYVASYDTTLYCLASGDGVLIGKVELNCGGIFCSGICSAAQKSFYIATLNGTCISLSQDTNEILWKRRLESPIFASSVLVNKDQFVLFAEVTGYLNFLCAKTGDQIWRYECNGNVYSTPAYSAILELLVFGCFDKHLYCLQLNKIPTLAWKIQLDSPVFAMPRLFPEEEGSWVAFATTNGHVYLCSLKSGLIKAQIKLDGEVFSSPQIYNGRLIVGCRDNNVYCLKIDKQTSTNSAVPYP